MFRCFVIVFTLLAIAGALFLPPLDLPQSAYDETDLPVLVSIPIAAELASIAPIAEQAAVAPILDSSSMFVPARVTRLSNSFLHQLGSHGSLLSVLCIQLC